MTPGQRYRIRYKRGPKQRMLEAVMDFLEYNQVDGYIFSARPEFGTQTIPSNWMVDIQPVAKTEKIYVNKRVRIRG